jgi:hypothetical protein
MWLWSFDNECIDLWIIHTVYSDEVAYKRYVINIVEFEEMY